MAFKITGKDTPEKTAYIYGLAKGMNTLEDKSLIDDHEMAYSQNARLVVDGVLKRQGSLNFGSSSGSRVFGGVGYYTSAGIRFIVREGGTALEYYDGSSIPQNISGALMTAGLRTEFAEARDALYAENGTDPMVKITIVAGIPTAATFTALTVPTGVSVTPNGTTGSTNYSYRVSAFNSNGETIASVSTTISNGNKTLTSTNFNAVAWNAVANAAGYNIYGRQTVAYSGIGETKLATVTSGVTYNDTGVDTPSTVLVPPEGNSTGGQKGSIIIYAMSRLFVTADASNPSRLYYSAGSTQIDDFSTAYNGGFVDVAKNDGDAITALAFFQNSIIVFKHRSIWQFTFTSSGLPQLTLITNEVGCESHRTVKIVNNALWFLAKKDGRAMVFTLGNVEQYFNALRTTQQSLKIEGGSMLDSANIGSLNNACAAYFRNQYILCLAHAGSTTNNRCYVYDSRFGCWVGFWDGINANAFFPYADALGNEELYYASETTGYVVKMFTGTSDNGVAIPWKIQTKSFMEQFFDQYKIYRNPIFWFKDVTGGSITGYLITDGIFTSGSFNISPQVSGIGFGFDKWGRFLWGTSQGAATTTANSDQPMEIITTKIARSIQFELDDTNPTASFKFLGFSYRWLLLEGKPLPSANRLRLG